MGCSRQRKRRPFGQLRREAYDKNQQKRRKCRRRSRRRSRRRAVRRRRILSKRRLNERNRRRRYRRRRRSRARSFRSSQTNSPAMDKKLRPQPPELLVKVPQSSRSPSTSTELSNVSYTKYCTKY